MRHGRGFKYMRAVPADLQVIEGRKTWVKCLGAVSVTEAETIAYQLAAAHGQRIAVLRARLAGSPLPFGGIPQTSAAKEYMFGESRQGGWQHGASGQGQACSSTNQQCVKLVQLFDLWHSLTAPRSQKTISKMRRCVARFVEIVGDLPPAEITRSNLIAYRETLMLQKGINLNTVSEHVAKLSVLFNVAQREGLIELNPAHNLSVLRNRRKLSDRRQAFLSEQVSAIFTRIDVEPEHFRWVVRLLAYHGMRSGEACQLTCEDITVLHGIPVIRIHDRYGSVKNQASVRDIPIHPTCRELLSLAKLNAKSSPSSTSLFFGMPHLVKRRAAWFQDYASRFFGKVGGNN